MVNLEVDFETNQVSGVEIEGIHIPLVDVELNEEVRDHIQWIERHVDIQQLGNSEIGDLEEEDEDDERVEEREWEDDELRRFIEDTTSSKQKVFLRTLVSSDNQWVPKSKVMEQLSELDAWDGDGPHTYTMIGLLGPMRRRAPDDVKPFWRSSHRGGERQYAIRDTYRDRIEEIVAELWESPAS